MALQTLGKEKIFIVGGSWGTELGTFACARVPDKIAGYIGYGQVVNGVENENLSYAFAMRKAKEANDSESIAKLEQVGPPVNGQYKPVFEGLMTQRRILGNTADTRSKRELLQRHRPADAAFDGAQHKR